MSYNPKFIIIATGFNCHEYVISCAKSVVDQSYNNWELVMVCDGGGDRTIQQIKNIETHLKYSNPIHFEFFEENKGACLRRYEAITKYSKNIDDIILFLGMDDELFPNCLERVKNEYNKGVYMTYGNWRNQYKEHLPKGFLNFSPAIHQHRNYRKDIYRSTAPNTFYRYLFDQIPVSDFMIDGKWIDTTTESEVMFSCMELSGEKRIGVIEDKIYFYRENLNTGSLKRLGKDYKYKILEIIKSRPIRDLLPEKNVLQRTIDMKMGKTLNH